MPPFYRLSRPTLERSRGPRRYLRGRGSSLLRYNQLPGVAVLPILPGDPLFAPGGFLSGTTCMLRCLLRSMAL